MNTAMTSFNTIMGQLTKITLRKKQLRLPSVFHIWDKIYYFKSWVGFKNRLDARQFELAHLCPFHETLCS